MVLCTRHDYLGRTGFRSVGRAPDRIARRGAADRRARGVAAARGGPRDRAGQAGPAAETGVIPGYGPEIDPAALGYGVTAFVTLEIRQAGGEAGTWWPTGPRFRNCSRCTRSPAPATCCAGWQPVERRPPARDRRDRLHRRRGPIRYRHLAGHPGPVPDPPAGTGGLPPLTGPSGSPAPWLTPLPRPHLRERGELRGLTRLSGSDACCQVVCRYQQQLIRITLAHIMELPSSGC